MLFFLFFFLDGEVSLRVDRWAIAEAVLNQPHITPPPTPHCRFIVESILFIIESWCGQTLSRSGNAPGTDIPTKHGQWPPGIQVAILAVHDVL